MLNEGHLGSFIFGRLKHPSISLSISWTTEETQKDKVWRKLNTQFSVVKPIDFCSYEYQKPPTNLKVC